MSNFLIQCNECQTCARYQSAILLATSRVSADPSWYFCQIVTTFHLIIETGLATLGVYGGPGIKKIDEVWIYQLPLVAAVNKDNTAINQLPYTNGTMNKARCKRISQPVVCSINFARKLLQRVLRQLHATWHSHGLNLVLKKRMFKILLSTHKRSTRKKYSYSPI